MTTEQLQYELHKIDLILRPHVLFVNPDEYNQIIKAISDLQAKVKIISTNAVEIGHVILIDRKQLEEYGF